MPPCILCRVNCPLLNVLSRTIVPSNTQYKAIAKLFDTSNDTDLKKTSDPAIIGNASIIIRTSLHVVFLIKRKMPASNKKI